MAKKTVISEAKLDVKDRKILFELDFNARQSNSAIAKKVGLSKQGVDYRIASLIRKGVVTGFYPVVDIGSLGRYYCRLFFRWQNITEEKEAEIQKALAADQRISWIVAFEGAYDLIVASYAKKLEEFKRLSEDVLDKYGVFVKEKKESIGISVAHFQSNYLMKTPAQVREELILKGTPPQTDLDKIDMLVLKELAADSRYSLVRIGEKLKLSPKVVAYRIRKLEHDKIILGYRPNIDNSRIGYVHYKILFYLANVRRQQLQMFKSYLRTLPELLYIVEQVGVGDVDIEVMLRREESLFAFIKKLKFKVPGIIRDYEILIADRTIKIEYVPF